MKSDRRDSHIKALLIAHILLLITPYLTYATLYFDGIKIIIQIIFSAIILSIPFILLKLRLRTYLLLLFPLLFITIIEMVHVLEFHSLATYGAYAAIYETNFLEASEFLKAFLETIPIIILFLVVYGIIFFLTPAKARFTYSLFTKKVLFFLLAVFIIDFALKGASRKSFPVYSLDKIIYLAKQYEKEKKLSDRRKSFTFDSHRKAVPNENETYLIVVGESMRRRNLSLYGYPLATTPFLDTLHNLIHFTDVISPSSQTRSSLRAVFSLADNKDYTDFYTKKSLIGLLQEAGFYCYWISNQARFRVQDNIEGVNQFADDADRKVFVRYDWRVNKFDIEVVKYFKRFLKEKHTKKVFVIHLMGSHFQYKERYPHQYDIFKDKTKTKKGRLTAHYNNSILYTDFILKSLITELNKASGLKCMVYFSDHGENLLDDKRRYLGHGFALPSKLEVEVPFLFWYSNEFAERFPDKIKAINLNRNKSVNLFDFFYSFSGLLEISFPGYLAQKDFFSAKYKAPLKRYVLTSDMQLILYSNLD